MAYSSIKLYEQMRKALSAPKRKKSSVTTKLKNPKMVPGAENWQAGAIIAKSAAEALKNYSAEQEDKADKAAAMRMLIDYNKPQAKFDPSKYGQTPDQLRDIGYKTVNYATTGEGDFGGDNVYDGDEPLSRDPEEAKAWQALYKEEADKTQNRFDEENPYGMARVKAGNYASLDGRAFPILSNIFGDKPDPKNMTEGDRASAMRMALMGDSIGRRDAETERLRGIDTAAQLRTQKLMDLENKRRYTADQKKIANQAAIELKGSPDGKPVPRKTGKGPNGILRYIDTGEKVFDPNIPPSKTKFFKEETALRKDFVKGAKDFIKVRDAYGRIQASASDPSAAGDLALIFNFMKVLDPGSTVREGEFATAATSAGIPERLRAQYNKVVTGERLADKQRDDFVARAGKLYSSQLDQHKLHKEYYTNVAKQYGLNSDNVIYDMAANTKISKTATSAFDAYYASLPKGASYIDPDGNTRKKQ